MATKKKAATRSTRSTTKKKAAQRPAKKATRPAAEPAAEDLDQAADKRRPGRPAGSTNDTAGVVDTVVSRCPRCGSTNRAPYWGKIERPCGVSRGGVEYTHLVLRSTRCLDCGTQRRDRHFENRPDEKPPAIDPTARDQVEESKAKRSRLRSQERGMVG